MYGTLMYGCVQERGLDAVWEVTISGAAGQVSGSRRRVAVAARTRPSGAGPFGAVVVGAARATTARTRLDVRGIARALWPGIRIARVVRWLFDVRFVGVRIIGWAVATVLARSLSAEVQSWGRDGIRWNDRPCRVGPASRESTFVNHFRSN